MRLLLRYARFQLFDCVMLLQDAASDEPRDRDVDSAAPQQPRLTLRLPVNQQLSKPIPYQGWFITYTIHKPFMRRALTCRT